MNKKCKSCGANVPMDAKFCQMCGSSDFAVINDFANQSAYDQQDPVNQLWQASASQEKPKKKNKGRTIALVAVVLLILAGIGMVAEKRFQEQGNGDNVDNNYSYTDGEKTGAEETPDMVYYSKGTLDGSVYTNDWADIKFKLPEGFSSADQSYYLAAENSNTECGLYAMSDDTMGLIFITYERLPSFPSYDEESYLDSVTKSLKNVKGVTYKVPDTYTTQTIGGYTYLKAECGFNNGNGDFVNTFYARKLDKYMIVISAMGVSCDYNDALVGSITTAK